MKKILAIFAAFSVLVGVLSFSPVPVHAADAKVDCAAVKAKSLFALNSWNAYLPCDSVKGSYIGSIQDVAKLIFWLIDCGLKIAGFLAFVYIAWGGVKMVKAQGDPSEIQAARKTITEAIIGLVICISATAIVNWVTSLF